VRCIARNIHTEFGARKSTPSVRVVIVCSQDELLRPESQPDTLFASVSIKSARVAGCSGEVSTRAGGPDSATQPRSSTNITSAASRASTTSCVTTT